jgi:hypothetical protein
MKKAILVGFILLLSGKSAFGQDLGEANLLNGNVGPQIIRIKRVPPFFEGLVGDAHNNQNNFRYQAGLVFEF